MKAASLEDALRQLLARVDRTMVAVRTAYACSPNGLSLEVLTALLVGEVGERATKRALLDVVSIEELSFGELRVRLAVAIASIEIPSAGGSWLNFAAELLVPVYDRLRLL